MTCDNNHLSFYFKAMLIWMLSSLFLLKIQLYCSLAGKDYETETVEEEIVKSKTDNEKVSFKE